MIIKLEFRCDGAAFDDEPSQEMHRVLETVPRKVVAVLAREALKDTVCDAPEADDLLLDINGNVIGKIVVLTGSPDEDRDKESRRIAKLWGLPEDEFVERTRFHDIYTVAAAMMGGTSEYRISLSQRSDLKNKLYLSLYGRRPNE
jgi:hypothetical protein